MDKPTISVVQYLHSIHRQQYILIQQFLQFLEVLKTVFILFLDLPDEGPVITGGFPRYHIGDKVQINCTSHKSKPAAKLRWYINGEQADHQLVKHYKV